MSSLKVYFLTVLFPIILFSNTIIDLNLTQEEQLFISKKTPIIYMYDPDWAPFEWQNGISEHEGMIADILELIQEKSGLIFQESPSSSWVEAVEKLKRGAVDMASTMSINEKRKNYVTFTKNSTFTIPYIFVNRKEKEFSGGFDALGNATLAVINGYAIEEIIKENYPNLKYKTVHNIQEGFSQLIDGKIDVFLLNQASAQYEMNKHGYTQLSISYKTKYPLALRIAFNKNYDKNALSIVDKTIGTFSEDDLRAIYKKWFFTEKNSLSKSIALTQEERQWLKDHPIIYFTGDPNWLPFEAFDHKGQYIGIVAEYLMKIENILGIHFERVATKSWAESVKLSKEKKVDIISETLQNSRDDLLFTKSYIDNDIIIVMHEQNTFAEGIRSIKDKKIALIADYGYNTQIVEKYPDIDFFYVDNIYEGLSAVSTKKVDALICTFALGSYTATKMGLSNVKIVGKTLFKASLGLGIREDYAPLVKIINKAIDAISEQERNEIFNHWIKHDYVERIDYSLIWKILLVTFLILTIIVIWNLRMKKEIAKRKEIESELKDSTDRFTTLYETSPDAIVIMGDNDQFANCNKAALKMFGMTTEEEFLQLNPLSLSPEKQRNLHLSADLILDKFETIKKGGTLKFEWLFKRIDNDKVFDAHITLTSFLLSKRPHIHIVIRDITDQKKAELEKQKQQEYVQTLLDSQEQLIITQDGTLLSGVNVSFLNFFAVETLAEFKEIYHCESIGDLFHMNAPKEYLQREMEGIDWIDHVIGHSFAKTNKVMIVRENKEYVFAVSATNLPGEEGLKSAVFTNITEMENAKYELESIYNHTKDSINYASLIQGALIPKNDKFKEYFKEYLIIWSPKEIVGGDIYLFDDLRHKDECLLMVIDCTGHGVPGAFVTMLVKAIERQVVAIIQSNPQLEISPAWILKYFNKTMKTLLHQDKDSLSNVGFDGGIVYYNKKDKVLKFAGANTHLFYTQDHSVLIKKGDRYSIGYKKSNSEYDFHDHEFKIQEDMQFYITTDGYIDQNGGEKGFPFGRKRFVALLEEIHNRDFTEQKVIIEERLEEYQGDQDKNDDITLIGIKI